MATQSKLAPAASAAPSGLLNQLLAHPLAKRGSLLSILLVFVLLRKRLLSSLPGMGAPAASGKKGKRPSPSRAASYAAKLAPGKARLSDKDMEKELERLYEPKADGSRDLLVPHRGRISKVNIRTTPQSVYDAHYDYFKQLPPVAGVKRKPTADGKQLSQAEVDENKKAETKALREAGGAAAATAKNVTVGKEFFRQLRAIFMILIPSRSSKEVFLIALHTSFLILRTYLSVLVARLDGAIVKSLVSADFKGFLRGLGLWYLLAIPSTYTNSMIRFLQSKLAISFRTNLSRYIHDIYLNNKANFYSLINLDSRIENADQFITTDVARFCEAVAALYSNVSKPTLDIIIFNIQLGAALGGRGLLGMFVQYVTTGLVLRSITPAFGKLAAIQQKLEGDFRNAHSRAVVNSEEIAFYNGASTEASILDRAYSRLARHITSILKVRVAYSFMEDYILKYSWSASGYVLIASPFLFGTKAIVPTAAAPASGDKAEPTKAEIRQDGGVADRTESYISSRRLLLSLADAGSRLMAAQKDLTELAGYTSRVYTLLSTLHLLDRKQYQSLPRPGDLTPGSPFYDLGHIEGKISYEEGVVSLKDVPIVAPAPGMERGGEELVKRLTFLVKRGDHMLITGPNGVGKTALARVLAELWPVFEGEVKKDNSMMFLPQRPYLSAGSLRDQLIYPHTYPEFIASGRTDADLQRILEAVHLAYLPTREGGWETRKEWKDILSGGEKQRTGMARLLYHNPRFGVLDECTSAVSTDVEGLMYAAAKEQGISLITISHRPSLMKYHSVLLHLTGEHGAWKIEQLEGDTNQSMSFDEEIKDLEAKLKDVGKWQDRLEQIKQELGATKPKEDAKKAAQAPAPAAPAKEEEAAIPAAAPVAPAPIAPKAVPASLPKPIPTPAPAAPPAPEASVPYPAPVAAAAAAAPPVPVAKPVAPSPPSVPARAPATAPAPAPAAAAASPAPPKAPAPAPAKADKKSKKSSGPAVPPKSK